MNVERVTYIGLAISTVAIVVIVFLSLVYSAKFQEVVVSFLNSFSQARIVTVRSLDQPDEHASSLTSLPTPRLLPEETSRSRPTAAPTVSPKPTPTPESEILLTTKPIIGPPPVIQVPRIQSHLIPPEDNSHEVMRSTPTPRSTEQPIPEPTDSPNPEIYTGSLTVLPYDPPRGVTSRRYTYSLFNVGFGFGEHQRFDDDRCEGLSHEERELCLYDSLEAYYEDYPDYLMIEAGLITNAAGEVRWYILGKPGVERPERPSVGCYRGIPVWLDHSLDGGAGCLGDNGDLVSIGASHHVTVIRQIGNGSAYNWQIVIADSKRIFHPVAEIYYPHGIDNNDLAWSVVLLDVHGCTDFQHVPPSLSTCNR